ncbi:PLC-like phosphodiesterase [Microthyrium microscopicum]|uniref:Phosphoinositide phospholipase C n=1 Tax=Microthyrium microscopicum TaxID=703497 RepID=A0A6A6UCA7_9PEZI|nr:PLC-like phosphodiesterase [Microthyrium microscopicum]
MSRSPGDIVRRLSKGAHSRLGHRRGSNVNTSRDLSAGPMVMRRLSGSVRVPFDGSRATIDNNPEISDLDLDSEDDEAVNDLEDRSSTKIPSAAQSRPSMASSTASDGIGPLVPAILRAGTTVTKVAKKGKKPKEIRLRLDFEAAKFSWDTGLSKQVYIDDVQSIQDGLEAKEYRNALGYLDPEIGKRWFTIVYRDVSRTIGAQKTMHLIAEDESTCRHWIETINQIQRTRIETMTNIRKGGAKSLKDIWKSEVHAKVPGAEFDGSVELDFDNIKILCRKKLGINCSDAKLREQFLRADQDHTSGLNFQQFRMFIKRLRKRHDIKQIFQSILSREDSSSGKKELDQDTCFRFLRDTQGIDVDKHLDWWTGMFEKYCQKSRERPVGAEPATYTTMHFPAFQAFLLIPEVSGDISHYTSGQPLNRPLNEYFVSSSHNTYLPGKQVLDESTTQAYVNALSRNCRCIEIDCWNGEDGEPIVMHGRAFTSSIGFTDCIKVINENAFRSSDYPLIISLEVHCNPAQQVVMVNRMHSIFGARLLTAPIDDSLTLPTPEELRNRILIKVKASSQELTEFGNSMESLPRRPRGLSSPFVKPVRADIGSLDSIGASPLTIPLSKSSTLSQPDTEQTLISSSMPTTSHLNSIASVGSPICQTSSSEDSDVHAGSSKKKMTSKIVRALGDLGIYTKGIKYSDFKSNEGRTFNHIYSFAEKTFESICNKENKGAKAQLEKHNRRYLMRVYPSATRIRSDNFEPLKFWRRGVQFAALNWQTNDLGMQLNTAMFAGGDDSLGYVLKPADLRPSDASIDPESQKPEKKRVKFSIDVISGHQLPRARGQNSDIATNPYVEVEVFVAEDKGQSHAIGEGSQDPSDSRNIGAPLRLRTSIAERNVYDPSYHQKFNVTVHTRYPSLVFIRWTVHHSDNGRNYSNSKIPMASYTAKLESLRQGYRAIPLTNVAGERFYFSSVFCKIHKEDIIPVSPEESLQHSTSPPQKGRGIMSRVFGTRNRTPSTKRKETDSAPAYSTSPPATASSTHPWPTHAQTFPPCGPISSNSDTSVRTVVEPAASEKRSLQQ